MAKSFPFESKNIGSSTPVWDRAITAQDERDFNKMCWTNGVFPSPIDGLVVIAAGGMKVNIKPGGAHIEGARFWESSNRQITLPSASATLPRVDRIVLRFDTAEDKRNIEIYLKEGIAATTPSPQDIVRQSNYYELVIADIYIPAGASEISNANITDQRANPEVCGLVLPAIPYSAQSEDLWLQLKDGVNIVNSALQGTTAGQLQLQITQLNNNKADKATVEITEATIQKFEQLGFVR